MFHRDQTGLQTDRIFGLCALDPIIGGTGTTHWWTQLTEYLYREGEIPHARTVRRSRTEACSDGNSQHRIEAFAILCRCGRA